jgi:hypothetical protein
LAAVAAEINQRLHPGRGIQQCLPIAAEADAGDPAQAAERFVLDEAVMPARPGVGAGKGALDETTVAAQVHGVQFGTEDALSNAAAAGGKFELLVAAPEQQR